MDKFEFRIIKKEEADEGAMLEQLCFPPHEACSIPSMLDRIEKATDIFLVAIDKKTGKIVGELNGIATDEDRFRDEFFTDINLHNPNGKNIMLLGLCVLEEYRGFGIAKELMQVYVRNEQKRGRKKLFLTCLDEKIAMYEKFGFKDLGISDSTWGNEQWHDMVYFLND